MERIAPLAKILAEANGIEWQQLKGTGAGGMIIEQDILDYLSRVMSGEAEPPSTPVDAPPPDWNGEDVPGAGMFDANMLSQAGVESDIADFVSQSRPASAPAPAAAAPTLSQDDFELDDADDDDLLAPAATPAAPTSPSLGLDGSPMPAAPSMPSLSGAGLSGAGLPGADLPGTATPPSAPAMPSFSAPAPAPAPAQPPAQPAAPQGGGLTGLLSRLYNKSPEPAATQPVTPAQATPPAVTPPAPTPPAFGSTSPFSVPPVELREERSAPTPPSFSAPSASAPATPAPTAPAFSLGKAPEPTPAPTFSAPQPVVEAPAPAPVREEIPAPEPVMADPEPVQPAALEHTEMPESSLPEVAQPLAAEPEPAQPEAVEPEPVQPASAEASEPVHLPEVAAEEAEVAPVPTPAPALPSAPAGAGQPVWFGTYLRRDAQVAQLHELREQLSEALEREVPLALLVARAAQRHAVALGLDTVAMRDMERGNTRQMGGQVGSSVSLRDALIAVDEAFDGTPDLLVVDAGSLDMDDLHYPDTLTLSVGRVQDGRASLSLQGDVDQEKAARFLASVAQTLEKPVILLV